MIRRNFLKKIMLAAAFALGATRFSRSKIVAITDLPWEMTSDEYKSFKGQYLDTAAIEALYHDFKRSGRMLSDKTVFTKKRSVWTAEFRSEADREDWIALTAPMFDLSQLTALSVRSHFFRA